jgi:radical SAM superfamily enzyme YgiQ (UPF0313 family)
MGKVMFIKPALETDAVWDPVRICSNLGVWYMSSQLRARGHDVTYLDEAVRDRGLTKRTLLRRELAGSNAVETRLEQSYNEFAEQKMSDYRSLGLSEFIKKYSAFRQEGKVLRTILRTGNTQESTLREIERAAPEIIGIPIVATANYLPATELARAIKANFPEIKMVLGGQHVSADPCGFVRDNPYVDQVVSGDAISVIAEVVEGRKTDRIVYAGSETMSAFPILNPDIIKNVGYPIEPTYTYTTNGRKSVDFMFSKGCFRGCSFCVVGSRHGDHRVTATGYERIDQQLAEFKRHGINELVVQDDAFLHDPVHRDGHLRNILALMKKYGFYWQNNGGIEFEGLDNSVTEQLIRYNKEGEGKITALYVPFNPRFWNRAQSPARSMSLKYHQNLKNLRKLRLDGGIYVFTSAMLGTPEQTMEVFEEELKTDKELIEGGCLDAALCLCATMLPGTEWFGRNGHNIINKRDYAGYSLFTTHHKTDFVGPKEIEEFMITWTRSLDDVQKTHSWGTAFPNS